MTTRCEASSDCYKYLQLVSFSSSSSCKPQRKLRYVPKEVYRQMFIVAAFVVPKSWNKTNDV